MDRHQVMQAFPRPWSLALAVGERVRWVPALLWSLAAIAMLGLLLGLTLVVQDIVRTAGLRHAATAARAEALWRCNALPGPDARDDCRRVVASAATPGTAH